MDRTSQASISLGERSAPGRPRSGGGEGGAERMIDPQMIDARGGESLKRELAVQLNYERKGPSGTFLSTLCGVLFCALCYYLATRIAWALCFPDSKVSLFFPPHAVLVSMLLLVPARQWWAYTLAAAGAHFLATQQEHWPTLYALHCEVFDAVQNVAAAAGIRILIKSPLKALTLRDAMIFVVVAVVLVPFGTAFWGAAFTLSNHFGTRYWIEWRNLGISNAVTNIILVPVFVLGAYHLFIRRPKFSSRRVLEAALVGACTVAIGIFVFDETPAGGSASPPLLYSPVPLLIWAALSFGIWGASLSMLVITVLAILGTMRGHGPFLNQTPVENALAMQLFLLMTAAPLLLLAVVIEEERRSKEALRQSKDQMGMAAEAANAAMWVWDVSGDDVSMTEQGRSLFHLKADGRIDYAETFDRVHPEDRARRESEIRRALKTRGEYEIEYRVLDPDGAVRWINGRARCVEADDGTGLKLFGVSMDVTARKQAEASAAREREELQQKRAQLEHVARVATLGELTATLTHELKQPLNAIALNASVGIHLLKGPQPDLKELRETLADISDTTQRAGEMIQGMRDMLRRDTAGFTSVDLNHVIGMVERIIHSDAVRQCVTVDLDLSPSLLPISGDAVQLQQVMLNLMLNAFGAMKDTERGARRLVVRTTSLDGSNVLIEVRDSGTGIPPEKLESIFEPFITSKPDGLGIGLSICRTIVERHDGKIGAANNLDGGATFSITLPITPVNREN